VSLYVLDTDHVSLYRYGHAAVAARVESTPVEQLATTIITIEEQISGWYTQVRKARDADKLARAYEGLFRVIQEASTIRVLPFTSEAIHRYLELRKLLPRQGKLDLSIAAIVLENAAILVTRNRADFDKVPGIVIEDWSVPSK